MKQIIYLSILILTFTSCEEADLTLICEVDELVVQEELNVGKVLIIGIDGFRSDVMLQSTSPFLWDLSLRSNTLFNPTHNTEFETSSGPNWSSILTGVHQDKHMIMDNGFLGYNFEQYPHFFEYIERANPALNTASIANWLPIHYFLTKDIGDYAPVVQLNDTMVRDEALVLLTTGVPISPDVLFLHFDDLDHFGHSNGYSANVPEYSQAVSIMDAYVAELMAVIEDKRTAGEDWLVLIVSDHGGEGTGHSGLTDNPNVNQTVFFANHPTIAFESNIETSQADLVPTILEFMGVSSDYLDCAIDGSSVISD